MEFANDLPSKLPDPDPYHTKFFTALEEINLTPLATELDTKNRLKCFERAQTYTQFVGLYGVAGVLQQQVFEDLILRTHTKGSFTPDNCELFFQSPEGGIVKFKGVPVGYETDEKFEWLTKEQMQSLFPGATPQAVRIMGQVEAVIQQARETPVYEITTVNLPGSPPRTEGSLLIMTGVFLQGLGADNVAGYVIAGDKRNNKRLGILVINDGTIPNIIRSSATATGDGVALNTLHQFFKGAFQVFAEEGGNPLTSFSNVAKLLGLKATELNEDKVEVTSRTGEGDKLICSLNATAAESASALIRYGHGFEIERV